jgi:hypothetical protein
VNRARTSGMAWLAVPLVLLGQYGASALLDGGYLRSRVAFYVAVSLLPLLVGLAMRRHLIAAGGIAAFTMVGTAAVYKLGIQPGHLAELGNDFDWMAILLLAGILIMAPALLLRGSSASRGVNASA